jgi:tripartite-type tricarboxylate transporter receptor subunit TctC
MKRFTRFRAVVLAACLLVLPATAAAQGAPTRIVVGGPGGGNTDIAARLVVERLAQLLGTTVIVENKPGAGGVVAAEFVKNAKPDGTTIALVTASNAANETIMKSKSYSLVADLEPVGLYAWLANVLIVTPSIKAGSVAELAGELKTLGNTNYSSGGVGSPGHLSGETYRLRTGVPINHIPYKGAPPAVLAVMTGETALMFATASAALPQIRAGKVRALAVTSTSRLSELPDVPTFAEAGLPNFDVRDWVAFVVPKGTPAATVERLHRAFSDAFADASVRERLEKNTMLVASPSLGPDAFRRFLAEDVAKWARTVREAGIALQ